MPYNQSLAQRMREVLYEGPSFGEEQVFGGVDFMLNCNMAVGVNMEDLIVRVGKESDASARALPHSRHFDFAGKPMQGWIFVSP